MTYTFLKKSSMTSSSDTSDVRESVQTILDEIEAGGDEVALKYAAKFDQYEGNLVISNEEIER